MCCGMRFEREDTVERLSGDGLERQFVLAAGELVEMVGTAHVSFYPTLLSDPNVLRFHHPHSAS